MTVDYRGLRNKEYKGDDYKVDEELGNGPKPNRKCTDCWCLIFFNIIVGVMLYWCIDSYILGDPAAYVFPVSGDGSVCGLRDSTV